MELQGTIVSLREMEHTDTPALYEAGRFPELWEWTTNLIKSPSDMESYVQKALQERDFGISIPFVTIENSTGAIIGSSRFGNISESHRRMEIGWTWLTPSWQRTGANTEAKLLMLTYAFETKKCIRVELKTDVLNTKSRTAIQRLGATEEGVLRHHVVTKSGRTRDTVYYSILASEWPAVRKRLELKLAEYSQ